MDITRIRSIIQAHSFNASRSTVVSINSPSKLLQPWVLEVVKCQTGSTTPRAFVVPIQYKPVYCYRSITIVCVFILQRIESWWALHSHIKNIVTNTRLFLSHPERNTVLPVCHFYLESPSLDILHYYRVYVGLARSSLDIQTTGSK